jgi:RHS repeat-associated protein
MVGSTRTQTDGAGVVVARFDYEAFGEVSQQAGSAAADELHRFTGKPIDGTGLYYFNARYMDLEIRRFISRDPAMDGANWWAYCYNKPLAFIDPDGEIPFCIITGGIGALIGAGYEAFMSWRETGGIAWDRVGKGAVIGGAIGLGFGAGSTFLCTGSFTGTASQLW